MRHLILLVFAAAVCMTACGGGKSGAAIGPPDKLLITAIPDDNAEELKERFGDVARYLEARLGIPVEYTHVNNYAASVTALATGRAHLAWYGGVTTVQAWAMTREGVEVVCCREKDLNFVTYFIANKNSGVGEVKDLKELAEKAKGMSFAFGDKSSTSGHIMPRHFLIKQTGKRPEEIFGRGKISYTGSHDLTLKQVADGSVQLGALNFTKYDNGPADLKANARIIYRTPKYVDYSWTARRDLGPELLMKIRDAFLALDRNTEEGRAILEAFGAKKFVAAEIQQWSGIKAVVESGVDIGP